MVYQDDHDVQESMSASEVKTGLSALIVQQNHHHYCYWHRHCQKHYYRHYHHCPYHHHHHHDNQYKIVINNDAYMDVWITDLRLAANRSSFADQQRRDACIAEYAC